ncbi:hypothetical protein OG689_00290 [Kitasatospora sp. NBC_00240]|uniref:hypothetical protein n=1 Tax=Kitasatospora sp. NBC_00240 TaxID=2903567 RepID=UPI0022558255|nr:hypothetical protein [Kitasatospora sp. NBC_00240]MCX5207771.1 hypothetical protein [Kitasatospora sp. NBC_00240]
MTHRPSHLVTVALPAAREHHSKEILHVTPLHLQQALETAEAFQQANPGQGQAFDHARTLRAARTLPDSTVVRTTDGTLVEDTIRISTLVTELAGHLFATLELTYTDVHFRSQVQAALTNAFTGLAEQHDDGWLRWLATDGTSTGYRYNLFLVLQNEETAGSLAAAQISLTVTVGLPKYRVLRLTTGDTARFSLRVQALHLVQTLRPDLSPRTPATQQPASVPAPATWRPLPRRS